MIPSVVSNEDRYARAKGTRMSHEDAARARLLAYYEQKEREFLERVEELRARLSDAPDEATPGLLAREVARLTNLADEFRAKAEQLRPMLRDVPPR
jgi:hypothetical protein